MKPWSLNNKVRSRSGEFCVTAMKTLQKFHRSNDVILPLLKITKFAWKIYMFKQSLNHAWGQENIKTSDNEIIYSDFKHPNALLSKSSVKTVYPYVPMLWQNGFHGICMLSEDKD